jgi:hypothetical protein
MVVPTVTGFPRLPSRQVVGPIALLAVALLAGCSPGSGDSASPTTTTAAVGAATSTAPATHTPTTSAEGAAKAAVLAAYRAYWDDVIAVGATADWQSPRLAAHATGVALAETRTFLQGLKARGLVARGTVRVEAKVLSLRGARAVLYDCNSTSNFLSYDAKTGELRDKSSGRSNGKTVAMQRQGGRWKLAQVIATEPGRCTK